MVSEVLRYVSKVWVIDFCPETGILVSWATSGHSKLQLMWLVYVHGWNQESSQMWGRVGWAQDSFCV